MELLWHNYPEEKPRFSGPPMLLDLKDSPYYILGSWNPEKKMFCVLYDSLYPVGAHVIIEGEISKYAYIPLEKQNQEEVT